MRRNTVPCRARTRDAAISRRTIRDGGTFAEIVNASGNSAAPSSRARAMTGVNAPLPASIRSSSARANSSACSRSLQGSARTTASGSTDAIAAAASAQFVSIIGKAPAACSASTTSAAGLSATTTNGPCSAMAVAGFFSAGRQHAKAPLTARQCNRRLRAGARLNRCRSRNAATMSGLTPTRLRAACIVSRSAALPMSLCPTSGSGSAATVAPLSTRLTISWRSWSGKR